MFLKQESRVRFLVLRVGYRRRSCKETLQYMKGMSSLTFHSNSCRLDLMHKKKLLTSRMHEVLHSWTPKSLVDEQTSQNSFKLAKATDTLYNTFELADFD